MYKRTIDPFIHEGCGFIQLQNGMLTRVDIDDFEYLSKMKLTYSAGYVMNKKIGRLHRFLSKANPEQWTDHKDRDRLNNTKENLRVCSPSQNNRNSTKMKKASSIYKGVSYASKNRWRATIYINGKNKNLGTFKTQDEAAKAYDKSAIENFKEFANTNFFN